MAIMTKEQMNQFVENYTQKHIMEMTKRIIPELDNSKDLQEVIGKTIFLYSTKIAPEIFTALLEEYDKRLEQRLSESPQRS